METKFDIQVHALRDKVKKITGVFSAASGKEGNLQIDLPVEFQQEFFKLIDSVNYSLMDDKDNFYGYFLFQMSREIRLDLSSPTGVNFKGAKYVIYFNPLIFLKLTLKQMESSIKHEILHILSLHLTRANSLKKSYSKLAINMAMDIVVNKFVSDLPPYSNTLEGVNSKYDLKLEHVASFEYYVDKLQSAMEILEQEEMSQKDEKTIKTEYDAGRTHDIWEEFSEMDEKTMVQFTEKVIEASRKGEIPTYLKSMIDALDNSDGALPWNLYLKKLMGTIESNKKKTITRRNRRQPDRFDLRGELRSHKANIIVGIDTSASIQEDEFKQAMVEVLAIVRNYSHEITIIECDDQIQRVYKARSQKDLKDRMNTKGATKFQPVFEYANHNLVNLLIYFTDGKGEERLKIIPRGYKVLWVISGSGETLSLKEPYGAVKKLRKIEIEKNTFDLNDVPRGGFSMNNQESI